MCPDYQTCILQYHTVLLKPYLYVHFGSPVLETITTPASVSVRPPTFARYVRYPEGTVHDTDVLYKLTRMNVEYLNRLINQCTGWRHDNTLGKSAVL